MVRRYFAPLAGLILVAGVACAAPERPPDSADRTAARSADRAAERTAVARSPRVDVVTAGYRYIQARYIEPIEMDQIALNGMKGVSRLDKALSVDRRNDVVELRSGETKVSQFPAPASRDAEGWAMTTLALFAAAGTVSPEVAKSDAEATYAAIFGESLVGLDQFSRYATAEEARNFRAMREGYGGIGITIQNIDGVTKVVNVMPGTPAEEAGLKAEDSIVGIGGESIEGMELRAVVARLRGPTGTRVNLTVSRSAAPEPIRIDVERRNIVPNMVVTRTEGRIAYIQILRFSSNVGAKVAEAVDEARRSIGPGIAGVVLDIRNNPGGLLDQAIAVADQFLAGGTVVWTEGRHPNSFQSYRSEAGDGAETLPVVVLVNGRSASSSEIVAAALQDNNRAVLVGSSTFGKGSVQSVTTLPNGGEIILTWSRFHAPSGYTIDKLGVLPQVCTSGRERDPARIAARVAASDGYGPSLFQQWRSRDLPDASRRERLRANCPPLHDAPAGSPDVELEVAKKLLLNPTLYQRALSLGRLNLAERGADATVE